MANFIKIKSLKGRQKNLVVLEQIELFVVFSFIERSIVEVPINFSRMENKHYSNYYTMNDIKYNFISKRCIFIHWW